MDCITCGREIIGYTIERTAAVCSENHLLCNKCNNDNAHVCPFCHEKTLYCDILWCDYQSIILLIDMQRQYPKKRKSVHPLDDRESEMLDAEDEVIEEYVLEEEEQGNDDNLTDEWTIEENEESHTVGENVEEEDTDEASRNIKCVDSVLVGKLKAKKREDFNKTINTINAETELRMKKENLESEKDEPASDCFGFAGNETEENESDDGCESLTPSWAAMSSDEELTVKASSSQFLTQSPLPASKIQLKMKDKSLCARVFAYNFTLNNTCPQQNMKYVPLGQNNSKLPTFIVQDEEDFDTSSGEEEEDENQDSSHNLRKGSSLLFTETDQVPKNMPMIDFTTRFYQMTNKRLHRWHNVNKNPDNVMNLDDEQLFVWRNVKHRGKEFQTLFVVTAPKGDKRMIALLQKLQTAVNNNIYDNQESNNTSDSDI